MDVVLGWFDLNPTSSGYALMEAQGMPLAQQLLLYSVVVIGVVLSEAVAMARQGGPVRIELSRAWLAVACLVALVAFPVVWRQIGAMSEAAPLVQMGVAAQGGVFWGVIMAGAEKQVGA